MKAKVLAAALLMALSTSTALAHGQHGRGIKKQFVRIERQEIKEAKAQMVKKDVQKDVQKRSRYDSRRDFAQCRQCKKHHLFGHQLKDKHRAYHHKHPRHREQFILIHK